jgi:hypothetical protein
MNIVTLEQEVTNAQAQLELSRQEANLAFLSAAESNNAVVIKKADKARTKVADAQRHLDELSGALLAARDRERERSEAAKIKSDTDGWNKAERIAKDRQKLGVQLETAILNLVDLYKEYVQAGIDLHAASPTPGNKLHSSLLSPNSVESYFRLQMVKSGFGWALEWPWGNDKIKPLSDRTDEGNTAALEKRAA